MILDAPAHQFCLPECALEEFEKHLSLILEKTSLSEEEVKLAPSVPLMNIQVVSSGLCCCYAYLARGVLTASTLFGQVSIVVVQTSLVFLIFAELVSTGDVWCQQGISLLEVAGCVREV